MTHKFKLALLFLFLICSTAWSQSPNMINYQGVAINSGGLAIANQNISIRTSIHQATANGTIVYSEERNATTDDGGLFNIQIGSTGATATSGSWAAINWASGAKFLQVEMDPTGATNYVDMGTQQLVSVPYAQYANLSGALIPTATITPNQITTTGASTNQVLKYNGTNWAPAADVSAFALPYVGTDASTQSFKITNSNATSGSALTGIATGNGTISRGVVGQSTGTNGSGVYGTASGTNSNAVEGYTNTASAIAIKGTHAANGIAIEGSTSMGIALRGECTGSAGTAVYGVSGGATGIAIHGETSNGTGVKGYGNNVGSYAVVGSSLAGTGVFATSYTGTALDVNGNVRIAGGNTNPTDGAVLTSDASGNAKWQNNKIAFCVRAAANSAVPEATYTKVEFANEEYDLQNNFVNYAGSTTTNTSKFTAPVAGVYNFSSAVEFYMSSSVYNFDFASIHIYKNGTVIESQDGVPKNWPIWSRVQLNIVTDMHLVVGDKVWIAVVHHNSANSAQPLLLSTEAAHFSGHLVIAD